MKRDRDLPTRMLHWTLVGMIAQRVGSRQHYDEVHIWSGVPVQRH